VVDVVNTRSVYQFSKEFYVRAIAQFNSDDDRVLTDFLASTSYGPARSFTGLRLAPGAACVRERGMDPRARQLSDDAPWVVLQGVVPLQVLSATSIL
jgi:hypothetical protein